jgi:hypothetical protein
MAMIAPEHANQIVWKTENEPDDTDMDEDDSDRMFSFEVAKTKEQDEGVIAKTGFNVSSTCTHVACAREGSRRDSFATRKTPVHELHSMTRLILTFSAHDSSTATPLLDLQLSRMLRPSMIFNACTKTSEMHNSEATCESTNVHLYTETVVNMLQIFGELPTKS